MYYKQCKVALQGLGAVYPTPVLALATCGAEFSLLVQVWQKSVNCHNNTSHGRYRGPRRRTSQVSLHWRAEPKRPWFHSAMIAVLFGGSLGTTPHWPTPSFGCELYILDGGCPFKNRRRSTMSTRTSNMNIICCKNLLQ